MIKLTYDQVMVKLKEKSGLSQEELDAKINEKLEQLSGLVSKDGAAHIVANELSINLFEEFTGKAKIDKLIAGMRNVECLGKVQAIYELREFTNARGEGKVRSLLMGDETGMTRVTCWHGATDKMASVKDDDVILVKDALVRDNQGRLELHLNDKSVIEINPEGKKIESVATGGMSGGGSGMKSVRKSIVELGENDNNVELFGTVVQMFEPRFFEVCPQCSKRARQRETEYHCETHGAVQPDYSYVLNAILDDGTETIRCVFFRESAEKLLGKTREEVLALREAPDTFESMKVGLLGQLVKLDGRATKNAMFDRLEFVARNVDNKPNPDEEIARVKEQVAQ